VTGHKEQRRAGAEHGLEGGAYGFRRQSGDIRIEGSAVLRRADGDIIQNGVACDGVGQTWRRAGIGGGLRALGRRRLRRHHRVDLGLGGRRLEQGAARLGQEGQRRLPMLSQIDLQGIELRRARHFSLPSRNPGERLFRRRGQCGQAPVGDLQGHTIDMVPLPFGPTHRTGQWRLHPGSREPRRRPGFRIELRFQPAIHRDVKVRTRLPPSCPFPVRKAAGDLFGQRVGIDIADDRQDGTLRPVPFSVISRERFDGRMLQDGRFRTRHGGGALVAKLELELTEKGAKARIAAQGGFRHHHPGLVLHRLGVQVEVAGNVAADGQDLVQTLGAGQVEHIAGHGLAGGGIGVRAKTQAQPFQGLVDVAIGEILRAPEGHMLDKMGKAALIRLLIAGAYGEGQTHRHRPGRCLIPEDCVPHTIRQDTPANGRVGSDIAFGPFGRRRRNGCQYHPDQQNLTPKG